MSHPSNTDQNYLEDFLQMLASERVVSKNTLSSYRVDIAQLLDYSKKLKVAVTELTHSDLQEYIQSLSISGMAASSVARKVSSIRHFFAFLAMDGIISKNPALHLALPKKPQSLPKALDSEVIEKLLAAIAKDESYEGLRDAAMLELLYSSGMRISELVTLPLSVLRANLSNREDLWAIIIKGKGGKERVIMINKRALDRIKNYLIVREKMLKGRECPWLFPSFTKERVITHISRQRFGQVLKQAALEAGLDPALLSPHKIRHSFATHLLQNGTNLRMLQEMLGHADISSTQIYTKVVIDDAKELVFRKHPLARKIKS
jgi:integrase/recombinase XerD